MRDISKICLSLFKHGDQAKGETGRPLMSKDKLTILIFRTMNKSYPGLFFFFFFF